MSPTSREPLGFDLLTSPSCFLSAQLTHSPHGHLDAAARRMARLTCSCTGALGACAWVAPGKMCCRAPVLGHRLLECGAAWFPSLSLCLLPPGSAATRPALLGALAERGGQSASVPGKIFYSSPSPLLPARYFGHPQYNRVLC